MDEEKQDEQPKSATTKEIFEDLKDWSGKVFQKVRKEADVLTTKGKLKLDLTSLKNKRGAEFRKLGMKMFHLLEKEKYTIPEAESNMERLLELTADIRDREQKMRDVGQDPPAEPVSGEELEESPPEK